MPPPLSYAGSCNLTGSAEGRWGCLGPRVFPKPLNSPRSLSKSSVSPHLAPKEAQQLGYQETQGRGVEVKNPVAWAYEERVLVRQLEKAEVSHR